MWEVAVLLLRVPVDELDAVKAALSSVGRVEKTHGPKQVAWNRVRDSKSRYARLVEWLLFAEASGARKVTLSFQEVERMIGGSLPRSAVTRKGWWASSQRQAELWVNCGWEAASNPDLKSVMFTNSE